MSVLVIHSQHDRDLSLMGRGELMVPSLPPSWVTRGCEGGVAFADSVPRTDSRTRQPFPSPSPPPSSCFRCARRCPMRALPRAVYDVVVVGGGATFGFNLNIFIFHPSGRGGGQCSLHQKNQSRSVHLRTDFSRSHLFVCPLHHARETTIFINKLGIDSG